MIFGLVGKVTPSGTEHQHQAYELSIILVEQYLE